MLKPKLEKLQAKVDMGVDTVYMVMELPDEIDLPYEEEKDYVKGVNAKRLPIHGLLVVPTSGLIMER